MQKQLNQEGGKTFFSMIGNIDNNKNTEGRKPRRNICVYLWAVLGPKNNTHRCI